MPEPKIISLGVAAPEYTFNQAQVFETMNYPKAFWRIFRDAGIEQRHFSVPLSRMTTLSFQEQQEEYQKQAIPLSKQSALNCIGQMDVKEIGCLVYCTCTGLFPGATAGDYLIKELGLLSSTEVRNVVSQGCEGGGFPGLSTAIDYVAHKGKRAIVIATELSGLTYYPEIPGHPNPENDYQCLRAAAIFGEASSAALIGYDGDWRHPTIVDQESYTDTRFIDDLGYRWKDGRLMVLLSKRVPQIAPLVVAPAVNAVLKRQRLDVPRIRWWVIHAAGISVIEKIRQELGIEIERVNLSLGVLREWGNCSSSTVGIVGHRLMSMDIREGDYVAVVTMGPGIRGGMSLLRFGN